MVSFTVLSRYLLAVSEENHNSIGNYVEESGRGLFYGTLQTSSWRQ